MHINIKLHWAIKQYFVPQLTQSYHKEKLKLIKTPLKRGLQAYTLTGKFGIYINFNSHIISMCDDTSSCHVLLQHTWGSSVLWQLPTILTKEKEKKKKQKTGIFHSNPSRNDCYFQTKLRTFLWVVFFPNEEIGSLMVRNKSIASAIGLLRPLQPGISRCSIPRRGFLFQPSQQ